MGVETPNDPVRTGPTSFWLLRERKLFIVFFSGCLLLSLPNIRRLLSHQTSDPPERSCTSSSLGKAENYVDDGQWKSPWQSITPSERLLYTPCFEDYQCARLEVPMDWNSTLNKGEKVALAIIKIPAQIPITDPRYGGAIIINPGGPGGSGVATILTQGRRFQTTVDSQINPNLAKNHSPSDGLYYDIMGYDPRGINNTTPRYECFSDPYSRQRWSLDNNLLDLLGSSDVATEKAWARAMGLAATCTRDGGPRIGQFMNTTPNVADIVEIIERLGEWREQETDSILALWPTISESEKQRVRDANRWQKGEELLQFWGSSYGTVVGATFAAMQPHRVKRLVLDGVCDAEIMYSGYWTTNILDTDKIMTNFFESCQQAGPTQCSFAGDGSPEDLEATLDRTLESLNRTPLVVPGSDTRGPDIITYSDVLRYIKKSVYEPLEYFPKLADIFTGLSLGNGSVLADIKNAEKISIHPIDNGQSSLTSCPPYEELILEVLASIACTDGEDRSALGKDDFFDYYEALKEQSKWMADIWAAFTMSCWGWKTRPKWRYEAHPIFWIGNTLDPATPVINAHNSAARFSGSVVLEQDSVGHCSYSARSTCTADNIRRYFQTGALPDHGTICKPDATPFGNSEFPTAPQPE